VHFPPLARALEDVRSSSEQFFGAHVGNELVGTASIESGSEARVGISTFVVAPEWHRRGVGGALRPRHTLIVMNSPDPEPQVAAFLAKYSPAIEAQLKDARQRLRAFFPRGFELVFDNYNALVFGISPDERASNAFISIAGYPKWVTLFFLNGAALNDPNGLLEGQGRQVRSIRLANPSQMNEPGVEALIAQAALFHQPALLAAPAMATMVKTVVVKQRPRRPAASAASRRASAAK
jgi:hypothetical protein